MSGFGDFGGGPGGYAGEDEFDLDFTAAEAVPEFAPVPVGRYTVTSHEVEGTSSKDGKSKIIKLHMTLNTGPFAGRKLQDGIYVPDKNVQEPDKYKQSMDFFCAKLEAITGEPWKGMQKKLRPSMLVNKTFDVYVVIKKGDNGEFNNIRRYYAAASAPTGSLSVPGTSAPSVPPVPSGSTVPPSPFDL